jgi:hypothetical protein
MAQGEGNFEMTHVTIVIREPGKLKPDYSLNFELPEIPRIGDYISIHRPDVRAPFGEDLIVRAVLWRLEHPETYGVSSTSTAGKAKEIFVECDPAIGPYSSDAWKRSMEFAKNKGANIEELQVDRFSVPENFKEE